MLANGLAPNKLQAIIWTNVDPIHWRIYVALGGDDLKWNSLNDHKHLIKSHVPIIHHNNFQTHYCRHISLPNMLLKSVLLFSWKLFIVMESYMECLGRNYDFTKGFYHILRKVESVEMDIIVYVRIFFFFFKLNTCIRKQSTFSPKYIYTYIQNLSTRYLGLLLKGAPTSYFGIIQSQHP